MHTHMNMYAHTTSTSTQKENCVIVPAGVPEENVVSGAHTEGQHEMGLPGARGINCRLLWTVENWKMMEGLVAVDYYLCRMVVLNLSYTLNQPGRSGGEKKP